jgi:cobalt/nickel transport system ATP-binding protein
MSHHIVEAKNLCFTYPDGTEVLKGVSFFITHGESVAVVGSNGAGKSTLLSQLNGTLTPTSGEVRIGDFPVNEKTLNQVRRSVGMLFQNPDDQLFMPTVYEDVAFGPLNIGTPENEIEDVVAKALNATGIGHLKDKPPYRLSGGEKRAAAISGVLAMSPDVLVLDEPSSNLDPKSRRNLMELLKTFTHTKIIATHDLDMAMDICDRVIVIDKGEVRADGDIEKIFSDGELLYECGLEKPLSMQGCPICSKKNL